MSEYQYYEFCKLNKPLTTEERKVMSSLSSRAKITTHGASYVYHYSDFRGEPKELLLKHFDVFFYIANWGTIRLMFRYSEKQINKDELKKHCVKNVVSCKVQGKNIILEIDFNNEDGLGWVEGEGMLTDLLPLYDEIKAGDYQFLDLVAKASNANKKKKFKESDLVLSDAQEAFFEYAEIDEGVLYE